MCGETWFVCLKCYFRLVTWHHDMCCITIVLSKYVPFSPDATMLHFVHYSFDIEAFTTYRGTKEKE